jgi:hypothetical protein
MLRRGGATPEVTSLATTQIACLKFCRTGKEFIGYVDSYFGVDLDKKRFLTGYMSTICDCAMSWRATLQPFVA